MIDYRHNDLTSHKKKTFLKEKYLHSRSSISTFEENSLKETFSIAASNVQKYSFWKTNFVKKSGKFTIKLGELFEEVEGGGGGWGRVN